MLGCFRVILELKTPFLIGVLNISWDCPFCIELSFKKCKSFQNLLLDNTAIFCKIHFCKLPQAKTVCIIYFWQSIDKLAKRFRQRLIPQKSVLAKIISLEVVAQVRVSVS